MKIRGIIAEFNPFHQGHRHIVDKMRDGGCVIAVMSGNFVQRGECAIYDKKLRAKEAVQNGCDLVLELPLVYSLGAAERFARGAVTLLDSCKVVDELWFGSEAGEIAPLCGAAELLSHESGAFKEKLAENLEEGMSFPKARFEALRSLGGAGLVLDSPNNILASEYIRALKRIKSDIVPVTIARVNADYNDISSEAADFSASAARKAVRTGKIKPAAPPLFTDAFDVMIASKLKTAQKEDLLRIADCNGEIAARLLKASVYNTFDAIAEHTFCRRYTQGRIRRVMCSVLVGNTFREFPEPSYIRPLAFNGRGAELLRQIKRSSSLPVAARGAALKTNELFKLECRGTDICALARGKEGGGEFSLVPSAMY